MGRGDHGGGGARRRAAARPSGPGQAAGDLPGVGGSAGRAFPGAGGGRSVAGVARGRGEPRAGGRVGVDGRRVGNVALGAAQAQRGRAGDEHAHRHVRGVRRPVVIAASVGAACARGSAPEGAAVHRNAGRGAVVVLGRVRGVLSDRGVDVRRDLHAAVVQVPRLAAASGRSPRPGRRGARADHRRCDRAGYEARRSARRADDCSLDDRGARVWAGRCGAAVDVVHREPISSRL